MMPLSIRPPHKLQDLVLAVCRGQVSLVGLIPTFNTEHTESLRLAFAQVLQVSFNVLHTPNSIAICLQYETLWQYFSMKSNPLDYRQPKFPFNLWEWHNYRRIQQYEYHKSKRVNLRSCSCNEESHNLRAE